MKAFWKNRRLWGVWVMSSLVLGWLFWTDPDRGAATRDMLQNLAAVGLGLTCAHVVRKSFLPYIKLETFVRKALENPIGAGLVVLGVLLFTAVAAMLFGARAHAEDLRTFVPANAYTYAPTLKTEQREVWPADPGPAMLGALVEQESCVTLHSPHCWNPAAKLKTAREEGAGMGQITRAYRADGSLRFDSLEAVRALDPGLSEWSWQNVYQRPDLQLRAIVVMNRHCFMRMSRLVHDPEQALEMCDAAYNGGYAGVQQERRACGQRDGCNPQKWFGNVAEVCLKSKVHWKGYSKSACEINREHVEMVAVVRRAKYVPLLEGS